MASRKSGAAEPGSWFGASLPTTWHFVHCSAVKSSIVSFTFAGGGGGTSTVRYGKLFADDAAKYSTSRVASSSAKWKVGMRMRSHGRSGVGPLRKPNSQPGCTFAPSPVMMGGA
ncbi:MAG: hypothetical protein ACJ79R_18385 [Anaeromyxobacteraceae bacterium]